jgi:DNA-binding response OmpR family regulator
MAIHARRDAAKSCGERRAIIFMTARGSPALVRGALNLRAFRVIEKPFDVTVIPALGA